MIVVSRFRFGAGSVDVPLAELSQCLDRLREHPGFVSGAVGRALDDPQLWLLSTTWEHVGAYRRALSSYDVKVQLAPVLAGALDEPSVFEVLAGEGATEANRAKPRGSG